MPEYEGLRHRLTMFGIVWHLNLFGPISGTGGTIACALRGRWFACPGGQWLRALHLLSSFPSFSLEADTITYSAATLLETGRCLCLGFGVVDASKEGTTEKMKNRKFGFSMVLEFGLLEKLLPLVRMQLSTARRSALATNASSGRVLCHSCRQWMTSKSPQMSNLAQLRCSEKTWHDLNKTLFNIL